MLQGAREVGGEGVADGVGVGVAFEPGGDAGGEGADVVFGEDELRCVAAQVGEEGGGRALEFRCEFLWLGERWWWRGACGGGRDEDWGGLRLRRGRLRRGCRGWCGGRSRVRLESGCVWWWRWCGLWGRLAGGRTGAGSCGGVGGRARLVVRDGAGDDSAVGEAYAAAVEVAVGFEFAQGGGDAGLALGEAFGEALDADPGSGGQRLDVGGQPDRGEESPRCWARWLPMTVKPAACRKLMWMTPDDGVASPGTGTDRARAR